MDQSPYSPPKFDLLPPDEPPKQSRIVRSLLELASYVLGVVGFNVWGFGLVYGWNSDSLLIFHILYALLILGPAIGIFIFAFAGREPKTDDASSSLGNWIGTIGCCIIGFLVLGLYVSALYYKMAR